MLSTRRSVTHPEPTFWKNRPGQRRSTKTSTFKTAPPFRATNVHHPSRPAGASESTTNAEHASIRARTGARRGSCRPAPSRLSRRWRDTANPACAPALRGRARRRGSPRPRPFLRPQADAIRDGFLDRFILDAGSLYSSRLFLAPAVSPKDNLPPPPMILPTVQQTTTLASFLSFSTDVFSVHASITLPDLLGGVRIQQDPTPPRSAHALPTRHQGRRAGRALAVPAFRRCQAAYALSWPCALAWRPAPS